MKRIYKFTFTSGNFRDKSFQSDLRFLAYLMYLDVRNEEQRGKAVVVRHSNMLENDLLNRYGIDGRFYELITDYRHESNKFFNPMLDKDSDSGLVNSFLITVYDGTISIEDLMFWLEINKKLLSVASQEDVKIDSVSYKAKSVDDESKRKGALYRLAKGITDESTPTIIEPKIQHKTRRKLCGKNGYAAMITGTIGR